MRPITIRVRFLDDTFKTLSIDSQSNARDVCDMLSKSLQITNDKSFSLSEMMDEKGVKFINAIIVFAKSLIYFAYSNFKVVSKHA